jgi:hypothetical protein
VGAIVTVGTALLGGAVLGGAVEGFWVGAVLGEAVRTMVERIILLDPNEVDMDIMDEAVDRDIDLGRDIDADMDIGADIDIDIDPDIDIGIDIDDDIDIDMDM